MARPKKNKITPEAKTTKQKSDSDIELTPEFLQAFKTLEESNDDYFVTGRAGTGKSTLLKYFREHTNKEIVVLAPTGVAAVNVGGTTIHSFFKFAPSFPEKEGIFPDRKRADLFRKLECLVIDEVSMVRADIMDAIDTALRINRGKMFLPFGGLQLILFGDLYQLPPVVESRELEEYFSENNGGPYFFNARIFTRFEDLPLQSSLIPQLETAPLKHIELTMIFRQKEAKFKELLEKIRNNRLDFASLAEINARVDPEFTLEKAGLGSETYESEGLSGDPVIIITTNNRRADSINSYQLQALSKKAYSFQAKINGSFDARSFPAAEELILKEGAQVMLLQNDPDKRWQNGTLAKISRVDAHEVLVNIAGQDFPVEPVVWKKMDYNYNRLERRIEQSERGSFSQYPLKLAWAITIHKSQGQSFDKVVIDLDRGAFAFGQTYVALSRCRTLEGITLTKPVRLSDVKVDPRIVKFMSGNNAI